MSRFSPAARVREGCAALAVTRTLPRRGLLLAGAGLGAFALSGCARTEIASGALPWSVAAGAPPVPVKPGPWAYFTPEEGSAVEAIVDRLIPPDPKWPGGKDAGCAVFIDRQLDGPYGSSAALYMRPPFQDGTPQQGVQSPLTPRQHYRAGLAALDKHCRAGFAGKSFRELSPDQQDALLRGLEKSDVKLEGVNGQKFFAHVLQNTQEGFFADPVYGGNRDMAGWRMIGFPGARYDYRDWVLRHNERYTLPPVGIAGRTAWSKA